VNQPSKFFRPPPPTVLLTLPLIFLGPSATPQGIGRKKMPLVLPPSSAFHLFTIFRFPHPWVETSPFWFRLCCLRVSSAKESAPPLPLSPPLPFLSSPFPFLPTVVPPPLDYALVQVLERWNPRKLCFPTADFGVSGRSFVVLRSFSRPCPLSSHPNPPLFFLLITHKTVSPLPFPPHPTPPHRRWFAIWGNFGALCYLTPASNSRVVLGFFPSVAPSSYFYLAF